MKTEMRQGKCIKCKIIYEWDARKGPLSRAYCPKCGHILAATSRLSGLPRETLDYYPTLKILGGSIDNKSIKD